MNTKQIVILVAAGMIATGAGGSLAYAEEHGNHTDAQALANSKISLSQAIATAEQQAGGKAVDAGVDNENGTVRIAVEVASNQGVKTVLVDPQTGQVTGTKTGGDHESEENDSNPARPPARCAAPRTMHSGHFQTVQLTSARPKTLRPYWLKRPIMAPTDEEKSW